MSWDTARRILCVRLDSLGDVLMTTPAMQTVRAAAPDRRITLLTSASGAEVAPMIPCIDETIVYDAPWLKATTDRGPGRDLAMIRMLRSQGFDGAIIFTVFSQSALPSALLCFLADIPLRIAHARENPYQLLTDWIPDPEPEHGIRHEVARQLALVDHIGGVADESRLILRVPRAARRAAHSLLADLGFAIDEPWILLHPGATAPSRRYPPSQFAAAARALDVPVVVTGSAAESRLAALVCRGIGSKAHNLAGMVELGTLAALIEAAPVVVTNNTGPAHIAAAVGTPVVDIYALTNPQHTPWGVPHRVLSHDVPCRNCFRSTCPHGHNDCIRRVEPALVAQATRELLEV